VLGLARRICITSADPDEEDDEDGEDSSTEDPEMARI